MERLTRRSKVNEALPIKHLNLMHMDTTSEDNLTAILEKLAYYEDLEESGLLKILPFKIGDIVYKIGYECTEGMLYNCEVNGYMEGSLCRLCGTYPCTLHKKIDEVLVKTIKITSSGIQINSEQHYNSEDLKSVFLTREEAELKLMEGENK